MEWMPPDKEVHGFQALVEDGMGVGTVALDEALGHWEAFCPIGRAIGYAKDRREAKQMVETQVRDLRLSK